MQGTEKEHLDELANTLIRTGGLSEDDVDRISSSPFLHTRLRARIEVEERYRARQEGRWLATLMVVSRAITVFVLVTLAAATAFWTSKSNAASVASTRTVMARD